MGNMALGLDGEKERKKGTNAETKENAREFSQGFPKYYQTFIPIPLLPQIWLIMR